MTLLLDYPPPKEIALPANQTWPPPGKWTYEDYCRLPENGVRYEIIEGELHMSPAPITKHQRVSMKLATRFENFAAKLDSGIVMVAPLDVILPKRATPVQPDIVFVAKIRRRIVKEKYVEGAPDILVEILSPSNWHIDRGKKARVYAKAGVREYWIVDPEAETIELFVLRKSEYVLIGKYVAGTIVRSLALAGLRIRVKEIFEF